MKTIPVVEMMQVTPLPVCARAIRTCWDSHEKATPDGDLALIHRVGIGKKHASTLEHIVYTMYLSHISRALLQELARHRIASFSVKSTRYCLKELKDCVSFVGINARNDIELDYEAASEYLVWTDVKMVDGYSVLALENLRKCVVEGISNDKAKFCLPDSLKTEVTFTINARSLRNFLMLRTAKGAMWEIRNLAHAIYEALPEAHRYLYEDVVSEKVV